MCFIWDMLFQKTLLLEKKNKTTGAKARVFVSAEKPAVLKFNVKKEHLELHLHYELLIRSNVLCSSEFSFVS